MSRYRLRALAQTDDEVPPINAVSLDIAERFFARPAILTTPAARGDGRRVLYTGTLRRDGNSHGPLILPLSSQRLREFTVEIEDGDNAPLTLTRAHAQVITSRLAFKWRGAATGLRLLYGYPRATAPQYDLGSLRQEVLAYAARPATLGKAVRNPSYGGIAADVSSLSSARAVLWITLVVLVAALLLIAVRLVKKLGA